MLLSIDKIFAGKWNCKACTKKDKKAWGCVKPINKKENPDGVWYIEFCLVCDGTNSKCKACKGSNRTLVWRCPRGLSGHASRLLPYFFDYYAALQSTRVPVWPDGRGRLYQPIALIEAFNLLRKVKFNFDEKNKDK